MKTLRAEIICVGTELLLGDILNTNAQYLSRALSELGIAVYNQQVVGDNKERLEQAVRIAKERSDIVIFSGGLGPTDDDLTKQTVAAVYNDELVHNAEIEEKIRLHFEKMNREMTDNNKKQAYVPKRGRYLPNENGTAPGIMFIDGEKLAVLLPGPPRELEPMMANQVMPILSKLVKGVIRSRYVKTMGIGESMLETKITRFLESKNPTAALYAKGDGEVTIRLTAKALEDKEAADMLDAQYKELEAEIGEYIYGVDVENAETVIVNTLKRTMQSVATAESCTGGKIASRITSVAGASQVFELGVCTYSDKQKVQILDVDQDVLEKHTAVSSEVAAQMAQNVRLKAESDYGVATTGYAGPDGEDVGLVYIAVATKDKTYIMKHHFAGRREVIINLASQYALDLLRRVMCGLPVEAAQIISNDPPKKKKGGIGKAILTLILLLLLATALAFGWLWYKNGMDISAVPIIKDFFSTPTVASVVAERQNTDFFQKGFEQETSDLASGSWAQNLRLEGWITFKTTGEEFAVASRRQSENDACTVYEDSPIGDMTTYAGFKGDALYTEEEISKISGDVQVTVFDTQNSYREYYFYSIVTYTQSQFEGLMKMSDGKDVANEAVKDSIVKFETNEISEFDQFIAFKQIHENGNITVYYAKNDTGGVVVQKPEKTPEAEIEDESSSADETPQPSATPTATPEASPSVTPSATPSVSPSATPSTNPSVTPTATPSVSPSATPSAKPTPTVKPTATPKVTPTVKPTATPKATATVKPTATPKATATVKPTATPKVTPTPTAKPTATPKPTPTPTAKPTATPKPTPTPQPEYTLTVTMNGRVVTGPANEILAQIVSKEMTSSWNAEALKAQAVATHTYLRYQYASGVSAPAVAGRETPYSSVAAAVNEVADKIMTINGRAVYTPYFASSAGRTNASSEVWGGHYSHLVSVESKYDHLANGYKGTVKISLEDMEEILDDIGIKAEGDPEDWFEIVNYTSGGYVNEMKICGKTKYESSGSKKTITGRRMREDILSGKGLRSAAFDIEYDAEKERFVFTTYGYGHGAGMSQWGAQLYAQNEGWSYKQILKHYYTGVSIESVN